VKHGQEYGPLHIELKLPSRKKRVEDLLDAQFFQSLSNMREGPSFLAIALTDALFERIRSTFSEKREMDLMSVSTSPF